MANYFTLSGPDNDSYMCASEGRVFGEVVGVPVCAACGFKTDPFFINPAFRLKRRTSDLSYTYDGYCIVSLRFKEASVRNGLGGTQFIPLPEEPTFFVLKPTSLVRFDSKRRETHFEDRCSACGYYGAVAGATPAFLLETPLADFARSDVLFGSGNARNPLLIASEAVKTVSVRERLRGLVFREAYV